MRALRWVLTAYAALLTIAWLLALLSRNGIQLEIWHTTRLKHEFNARELPSGFTYRDYLLQERALFAELQEQVVRRVPPTPANQIIRYSPDSITNPATFPTNWNYSTTLTPATCRGAAVLLHGLTDSPYSFRAIGNALCDEGYLVIIPRLPGHGTIPASLTRTRWQDWDTVARLAMQEARSRIPPDAPLLIGGFSNGGSLALHYALTTINDPSLPAPDHLILIVPAIGISSAAKWVPLLTMAKNAGLPGTRHSAWNTTGLAYDPYKYNAFAVNAGYQTHLLSRTIQQQLAAHTKADTLQQLPPVLTFQSLADATVNTDILLNQLYARLKGEQHELVAFDINRRAVTDALFRFEPAAGLHRYLAATSPPFALTLISNASQNDTRLHQTLWHPALPSVTTNALPLSWPTATFSLSHTAIPFPPDDPIYGTNRTVTANGVLPLGALELHGERGLLRIDPTALIRMRHNPFYSIVEQRVRQTARQHIKSLLERSEDHGVVPRSGTKTGPSS